MDMMDKLTTIQTCLVDRLYECVEKDNRLCDVDADEFGEVIDMIKDISKIKCYESTHMEAEG